MEFSMEIGNYISSSNSSPNLLDESDINLRNSDDFPHFICLGEIRTVEFHENSYLKSHELQRILNNFDPSNGNFNTTLNEFFGFKFLTCTCLTDSIQHLFYTLRMKYNKIKNEAMELTQIRRKTNEKEYLEIRRQIIKFLSFLKSVIITDINEETNENEILILFENLKSLILHIGRISQSPIYISLQTSRKCEISSALYHLYHVNLDIIWCILVIFHSLPSKYSTCRYMKLTDDVNIQSQSLFIQYTRFVISELIQLALKRFQKLSLHQYETQSPFSCMCVAELWVLLINLLDESDKVKSFWSYVQLIFNGILYEKLNNNGKKEISCDLFDFEYKFDCEDRLGFCWWLLLHLSTLYQIDSNGFKLSEKMIKSNYTLLQTLISLSIQSEKVGEAQMRCYLNCCLKISKYWEANTDILLLLANHFIRNINCNFCLPFSLDGFQCLNDSADDWIKRIKTRLNGQSNNENSFYLFLNLFNEKISKIHQSQQWEKLKNRILCKFDLKFMQELNEIGLHNFITILLVTASETELESPIAKMIEFIDSIPITNRNCNQRLITWCGIFALLEISNEKQSKQTNLINKLTNEFINITQQLKNQRMDVNERQNITKLITIYTRGIESIVQKSKFLNSSEYILINSGINNVLSNGDMDEIEKILSMTEIVLSKLRMTLMRHKNSADSAIHEWNCLANSLVKFVLPFVKQFCLTQTPPSLMADVAAGFTLMAHDMRVSVDLNSLFHHFGLNYNVQPAFCCRYLCQVLNHNILIQNLGIEKENIIYLLIGSWFRNTISLPENDNCNCELTRLIMKLSIMQNINLCNDGKIYIQFLKNLEIKFNSFENFTAKMAFRQNVEFIFKDVIKHNNNILKQYEPIEQLKQIYNVAAHIIKYCSLIIYVKSKADGIVQTIIHQLLLPRIIYCHDKPLPNNLQIVLSDNLHLFVEGLIKLGFRRDTWICNRLKDIVVNYILRFPLKGKLGASCSQPLLICLKMKNMENLTQFYIFALEILSGQLKSRKNSNLMMFVNFAFELYNVEIGKEVVLKYLFVPILSLLTHLDPNLKDKICIFASKIILDVQKCEFKSSLMSQLIESIQESIVSIPQNAFKLLEILMQINCDFVKQIIPDIGKCIEKAEEKRGVGNDENLRRLHQNLLKKLSYLN